MKKWLALVLAVLLGLTLCACAGKHTGVRDVSFQGTTYTIDYDAHTITDGKNTCTFRSSEYQIELTYPDGTRVTHYADGNGWTTAGTGGHWDESAKFFAVLQMDLPERASWNWAVALMAVVSILLGVVNIVFPEKVWRWQHLFTVEGGEPTDFALFTNRLCGGLLVAAGVLFLWPLVFGY